jgi:hypothetical protein
VCLLVAGDSMDASRARELAGDLGIAAVDDVPPLLAAIALGAVERPWTASARSLAEIDRLRLGALASGDTGSTPCRIERIDGARLGLILGHGRAPVPIGDAGAVGAALRALRAAHGAPPPTRATLEGVEPERVLDVILGPARSLSDPASKAALAPYGVPLPLEELCSTPSRAAAEASRIGFPVRIVLASPDLRIRDHPDLAADGVDSAARARDVFRQVTTLAKERAPNARLLGVTVTATTVPRALLRVQLSPLSDTYVLATIGFADAHGVASCDETVTALPAPMARIERVLARLRGSRLLLGGGPSERRERVESIGDVLLRLAAFVHDWRAEVRSVEIDPLAVLLSGGVEVREACVHVGDAFVRSLESAGT